MIPEPRAIGVWQTAFLGDAVLTLPLLAALRARFPEAAIHLFVRAGLEGLFAAQPELASAQGFAKRGSEKGLAAAWRFGRGLKSRDLDLWISAHTSARSALVAAASGIPRRIGYDAPWFNRLAYTETVSRRFHELEEVERLMALLAPLGIGPEAPEARLVLPEAALARARAIWETDLPEDDGPVLGVHPGSTWPTKCWPVGHFSRVLDLAASAGARILLLAGPGEEGVARAVLDGAGDLARRRTRNLAAALSLPELAAVIGRLTAYLTNDSGPMHLAWVQGVPLAAVFGPTTRSLGFFPRGAGSTVLERDLPCRPCGLHGHRLCPEGHHRCMTEIRPEEAWAALAPKLGLAG
ncbi:glycosyltransferase family 9 protein [Desulfovibrio aminophilus]|nr:glycosyltransferase family 9 protein [Desulfovibrio aminophilus]MCM0755362.1 glycosyltransferase family 9 protein [Desulfovibrio aminophilus]